MREFLSQLEKENLLLKIKRKVSVKYEIPAIMKKLDGKPLLFENVAESRFKVAANLCSNKNLIAKALNVPPEHLLPKLAEALKKRSEPEVVSHGRCLEVVENVNLTKLPILTHTEKDGGPYVTSAIVVVRDPDYGRNLSFHRLMLLDERRFAIRVVEDRDTYTYLKRAGGELDAAIVIGNHPSVMIAAATSLPVDVDEYEVANALKPVKLVKCKTVDLEVPADSEILLEAKITSETVEEGPFPDITGTYDIVREQPVVEVNRFSHAKDAVYQAILPGGAEHRLLMGMPREPVIYNEVSKVCECLDVALTHGGCSWLHCIIKIKKKHADDGVRAIEAAFRAHKSLKHVVVVDEDVDIYDLNSVEYAIATRFQASKDLIIMQGKGSSLDPSANQVTRETSKVGVDATIPFDKERENFLPARIPGYDEVRVEDYVSD
ncbi:MAG: UbiD family decarboxylase [Candidatus Freyarchaeota archaeon]|nr:UbiD family decarboxylase [Candidatus Freyrarchaeum guaymaensis]